jgi:hypothetical protein
MSDGADPEKISLSQIADPNSLRSVWKVLRKGLRALRLQDFELAHDPLEHLQTEWELDATIDRLSTDLLNGSYRASSPEIVRAAKSVGLTRPLAFLDVSDLLLYKSLVARSQHSLLQSSKPWTRLGRVDEDEPSSPADSGWFRFFLKRIGQIWTITEDHEWLVETDIANFFPYIDVPTVLDHVLSDSELGEDAVRLLEHLLRTFAPMRNYRIPPTAGLPQENFNCSRVIAHTLLRVVDEEFEEEGRAERYSRYLDDIVVGAASYQEALQMVSRIQTALEPLGLHPNTAKTRILRKEEIFWEYMKDENDYLGEVDDRFGEAIPENFKEFQRRLNAHLRLSGISTRPKAWTRVLRRYYTLSRKLRDRRLLGLAPNHLVSYPDSARHILDYLSTFRLTTSRVTRLGGVIVELGGVYEDVELLVLEGICGSPNVNALTLREAISDTAWKFVEEGRRSPLLRATAVLVVGKFGVPNHLDELEIRFRQQSAITDRADLQMLIVLLATGRVTADELDGIAARSNPASSTHLAFLSAVMSDEERAVNVTYGLLSPIERQNPRRFVMRTRALFLAPLAARARSKRWETFGQNILVQLRRNEAGYRDMAAERWLSNSFQ